MTVAKMGTATACFRTSIHAPGLGSRRVQAGCRVRATYGAARPRASAVNTAKVSGGLGKRVAEGCSHERRGAGRGDDHGQDAGEEAARIALFGGERAAGAGEREADLELAGERKAEEEEQPAMSARKMGDWNWNPQPSVAPAARSPSSSATSTQNESKDAGGIDEAMRAEFVALFVAGVDQREAFQERAPERRRA